ncbi:MAG: undecaprenyl-phosphate glucose phosphotransferase [Gammaproteobacteria bacterium]
MAMMIRMLDMATVLLAAGVAYLFRFGHADITPSYWGAILIGVLLTPIVFSFFHIYDSLRGKGFFRHVFSLIQAVCILGLLMAGLSFFTKSGDTFSRTWFSIWLGLALVLLILIRCSILVFLRYMRMHGMNERRIVIFGAGELGGKLAATVQQAMWTGFRVVSFIDDYADQKPTAIQSIPVIQTPEHLSDYLHQQKIDEIWIALPLRAESRVKAVLHELRRHTITTRFVLDIFGMDLVNHTVIDLAGFPVLNICSTPMVGANRVLKAIEDRILAALILLAISPIFIPIAMAVKISSPGPIFYRQKRVGWNGNEFEMLKFRSMPMNAEAGTGPVWASKGDGRATKIGQFLRKTSLDELPQFINVLRGEMSIVGPRPERKVFVDEFKEKIPRYMQKHLVKAGITGWAQVNGWRGNTSLEKRIEYDLYYIEHWSLFLDIKIIFLTIFRGFVNRNAY